MSERDNRRIQKRGSKNRRERGGLEKAREEKRQEGEKDGDVSRGMDPATNQMIK